MDAKATAEPSATWRYSTLSEYAVPGEASTAALGRLRRIWKAGLGALGRSKGTADATQERGRPSAEALAGLLPRFEVEAAAGALAAALGAWPADAAAASRTRVVVGPPGAGTRRVVEALARRQGWREIMPPARAELLDRTDGVTRRLDGLEVEPGRPAAIAELQRWLLRSERALPLARRLLEVLRDPPGPLLVGCDSWAWSFLDRALGIGDLVGEPLALAALDAPRLAGWLAPPVESSGRVCRPADKPEEVIFASVSPGDGGLRDGGEDSVSEVLVKLAAAARGNPGLALELWRRSLRLANEEHEPDPRGRGARQSTLWAAPLENSEVVVQARLGSGHRMALHAILLHAGLERELLPAVLPMPRHDLLRRLRDLGRMGLVAENDGELSIPLAAYRAVREHLGNEGFLVDGF